MAKDLKKTTKGNLFKWTNYVHGWQPRYFILKNGILMYHKSEDETSFGCRGAIAVKASTITLHDFDFCRFDVGVCDYVWYLRSETKEERDRWIKAIEEQARIFQKHEFLEKQQQQQQQQNQQQTQNGAEETQLASSTNSIIPNTTTNMTTTAATSNSNKIGINHAVDHQSQPQPQQVPQVPEQQQQQQQQEQQTQQNNVTKQPESNATTTTTNNNNNHVVVLEQADSEQQQQSIKSHPEKQKPAISSDLTSSNPMWPKIDKLTRDQLYYAQMGLGEEGTTDGWQLFAEDGQMRLYTRELEIDGLVCDPLKAVHVVRGVSGFEMCHRFFSPNTRFEWEQTLESMKVIEEINKNTLVFHQIHKRIWPTAQRDAVFWSHFRKVDDPQASCLSEDDVNPKTRPDLKLLDVWIVCNNSTDKPEVPLDSCVRIRLTVSLVCETYIPIDSDPETVRREDLVCKIIYSSTINPGGWAPASILRALYKKEYPKFLDSFSNYVITSTKNLPIAFE